MMQDAVLEWLYCRIKAKNNKPYRLNHMIALAASVKKGEMYNLSPIDIHSTAKNDQA